MERQKREENSIIVHFVFYFILTIFLVFLFFYSILWQIVQIEWKKTETWKLYNDIAKKKNTWLTYEEFVEINTWLSNNIVVKEILKNMTQDFYNHNLVNNTKSLYKDFLDKKSKELNSEENIKKINTNNSTISKILPPYSDYSVDFSDVALTDYKFINYVESIIETFNFINSSSIGISKVNLVEGYAINKWEWVAMDSNIYYIPLSLSLKWTKSSIIDFLYFIENVGNISVVDKNVIIGNNYGLLSKNWIKKVLTWDKLTSNYNIFEHQIIDIDRITFNDYIDNSYQIKWEENFIDFVLRTQWKEEYEILVNLFFYIKWEPTYKLVEKINKNLDKYTQALNMVNLALKDKNLDWLAQNQVLKYSDSLKKLNEEVNSIKKNLWNPSNLEEFYIKSHSIVTIVDPIITSLKK